MALFAVIESRGTFRSGDLFLKPGANPVTEDQADWLRKYGPSWITVQEGRVAGTPLERIEPEVVPEPYTKFQGRDGKWYFHAPTATGDAVEQSKAFDTEEEVDAAILTAQEEGPSLIPLAKDVKPGPDSGTLEAGDVAMGKEVVCRAEGCGRTFTDNGARVNHENIKHPELKTAQ